MTFELEYGAKAVFQGVTIYAVGDTAAALLLGEFSFQRMLGIMFVGATFYALEIPNYFRWIDRKVRSDSAPKRALLRTALALAYFNPLWISRHLLFIALASGRFDRIDVSLLELGLKSWLVNVPISIVGNFVIQVKLPLRWRFFGSAVFSSLLAVYYALSETLFG